MNDDTDQVARLKRDLADERHAHAATQRALARVVTAQVAAEVNTGCSVGDGDAIRLPLETEDRRALVEEVHGLRAQVATLRAKLDAAQGARLDAHLAKRSAPSCARCGRPVTGMAASTGDGQVWHALADECWMPVEKRAMP